MSDLLVHKVCRLIKEECLNCPASEDTSYGKGTRMCRLIAMSCIKEIRKHDNAQVVSAIRRKRKLKESGHEPITN